MVLLAHITKSLLSLYNQFSCKIDYIKQLLYVVKSQALRTVSWYSQLYIHFPEKSISLDTLQERGHFLCKNSSTFQVSYKNFATCYELCIKYKVSHIILAVSCKKQDTFSAYSMHRICKHLKDIFPGVSQSLDSSRLALQCTPERIPKNRQHEGRK